MARSLYSSEINRIGPKERDVDDDWLAGDRNIYA